MAESERRRRAATPRDLRGDRSQATLAADAGVTIGVVVRLEHGIPVSLRTAAKVAKALGVALADLVRAWEVAQAEHAT